MGEQIIRAFEFIICNWLNDYLQNKLSCLKMFLIGFRYNSTTGTFTVPPAGDGYYYFSTYLVVQPDEYGLFDIEINGDLLCTAWGEVEDTTGDPGTATCSATTYIAQGSRIFKRATNFNLYYIYLIYLLYQGLSSIRCSNV